MNFIIVICEIIFAVLAVSATRDENNFDKRQAGILRLPFYFGYKRGDYLEATVKLINLSPAVDQFGVMYYDDSQDTSTRRKTNSAGTEYFLAHQLLEKKISLGILLYNKESWCMSIHVFQGKAVVESNKTADPRFNNSDLCLRSSSPCTLEINLEGICTDTPQADVLRPQFHFGYQMGNYLNVVVNFTNRSPDYDYFIKMKSGNKVSALKTIDPVSLTALANSSGNNNNYSFRYQQLLNESMNTLYVTVSHKTSWLTSIILFDGAVVDSDPEHNYTDVCLRSTSPCSMVVDMGNVFTGGYKIYKTLKSSPHEDMDTATVSSIASVTNESTSNVTVICSSIAGITFILLVIIASWKRCWLQRRPRATLGLQTDQNNFERFYVNLLFRTECQREIEEIEDHVYQEVDPPIYDVVYPSVAGNG